MTITLTTIGLFVMTIISTVIGNLKTIYLVKGSKLTKYTTMALDSLIYMILVKTIVTDRSFQGILIYVLGRTIAVYFTDLIISKTYNETYMINLYIKQDVVNTLEKYFLDNNLSFTLNDGIYLNNKRLYFTLHLSKKQLTNMLSYMRKLNINPTYDLTEVKTYGNIKNRL